MKSKLSLPTLGACAALAVWGVVGCSDEPAETQNNTNNNPNPAWAVPGTEILIVEDRLNQDVPKEDSSPRGNLRHHHSGRAATVAQGHPRHDPGR